MRGGGPCYSSTSQFDVDRQLVGPNDPLQQRFPTLARKQNDESEYFDCPHCGARVAVGAVACRECGSDAETGWAPEASTYETDVDAGYDEDEEFDYDDFLRREFPEQAPAASMRIVITKWTIAAVVALVCLGILLSL